MQTFMYDYVFPCLKYSCKSQVSENPHLEEKKPREEKIGHTTEHIEMRCGDFLCVG